MQSLGWSDRISSSTSLRNPSISGVDVVTSMPSETVVVHDATGLGMPFTETTQSRHPPKGVSWGWWQRVGTCIPFLRAASRMVMSSGTVSSRPFMVIFGMTTSTHRDLFR
jgi:hypothetical protein